MNRGLPVATLYFRGPNCTTGNCSCGKRNIRYPVSCLQAGASKLCATRHFLIGHFTTLVITIIHLTEYNTTKVQNGALVFTFHGWPIRSETWVGGTLSIYGSGPTRDAPWRRCSHDMFGHENGRFIPPSAVPPYTLSKSFKAREVGYIDTFG